VIPAVVGSSLVYLNALDNPLVYDDVRTVLDNPSLDDIWAIRTIAYRELTRPLVNFSYAVDRALWGGQLVGYHVTSILLHALSVFLVFQLARRSVEDLQRQIAGAGTPTAGLVAAFVAAGGFGLHPMMTEAVGYISGRSELLCSVFFLSALLAARRWMRGGRGWWMAAACGLWLLALLSKEIAAMWPVVVIAYDRLGLGDRDGARRRTRYVLGPLVGLTVLAGLGRVAILVRVENPGEAVIFWQYILVEIEVAFRYFAMLLWPSGQSIFHQVAEPGWPPTLRLVVAVVWLAAWLVVAWRLARTRPVAAFGMLWFILLLLPSAALVVLNLGEPMSEHRVYLASVGIFLAIGAGVGDVWASFGRQRLVLMSPIAAWLIVLGALTVARNEVWSDPVRLWRDAADKAPDVWVPHVMLGASLQESGQRDAAIVAYRRAVRLRPTEAAARVRLALTLAELGRLDEARAEFGALVGIDPSSAVGHNGLGAVALLEHKPEEARAHYEETLRLHPKDIAARQSLALMYETVWQNPAEALRLCDEVRRIAPHTQDVDACIERNRARLADSPAR
jgi:protein O-mannosyl-transferase